MAQKSVLISGCSEGGIGHTLALEWKLREYRVFATARTIGAMRTLELAGIECLEMDVTDPDGMKSVNDRVAERTSGKLDILVCNAGQGYTMPLLDCDLTIGRRLFDVNVFGVIATIQAFSSPLIAAQGTIVIIGSVGGVLPYPFGGIYGASKSAVMYLADVLRLEMYPFNVKVVTVCTGGVKSQIAENATKNYDQTLPRGSPYLPIEEQFKAAQSNRLDHFIDPKVYAKYVVTKVNRTNKGGWIWKGAYSTTIRFTNSFVSRTVIDPINLKESGLKKLRSILKTGSK